MTTFLRLKQMSDFKGSLAHSLMRTTPIVRGTWQSEATSLKTYEMPNLIVQAEIPTLDGWIADMCEPDLPWADVHFEERVSGIPHNPPPSYTAWPWHSAKEADHHIKPQPGSHEMAFDHSYPERFWPKGARRPLYAGADPNRGIRFEMGDLNDVVNQLKKDSWTRQAYLPVWFPEDTGGVGNLHEIRVPCTLGYHFIRNGPNLDINYFLRSCDLTRHFHNDVYFAMRLLLWVVDQMGWRNDFGVPRPGELTMFISNMHLFEADVWRYK